MSVCLEIDCAAAGESTNGVLIEADTGGVWICHGVYFLISETLSFYSSLLLLYLLFSFFSFFGILHKKQRIYTMFFFFHYFGQ